MPIYEYECAKCGHIEEALQSFSDKPLTKCPECTGKLHKLISQSTFHLKGSGWYVTDYAGKKSSSSTSKTENGKSDKTKSKSTTAKAKKASPAAD
jgi:putative FmdB family regulatory protein